MNGPGQSTVCDHWIRAHKLCLDLYDIMMLINSSHDIDEILHMIVEGSCKALGCESARISMREGDKWVIRYVSNLPDNLIGRSFTDEEIPHAVLAMTTRKPVAIDDAFHDDRANIVMMKSLGIRSALVLPLMEKGAVIGTLLFGYHSRAVSFTNDEIDYAGRMATGVAIALQDAQLYKDLEESKKLGDALNEIDTVLYSTQDYDTIMNKMLQLATDVIGAETALIFSKEGDGWMVRYAYNLPAMRAGETFSNTEVMHTAITTGTRRSLVVQDALNSPDVDKKFVEMLGIRSLLYFPLIVKGEVIGDLTFHYHSSSVPFNDRQVEFVRKLQISISLALENGRLLDTSKRSESKLKEAERLGKSGYFNYDLRTRKSIWSEGVFHILGRDPVLGEPTVEEFCELYTVDPGLEKIRELVGKDEPSEFDASLTRGDLTHFLHFVIRPVKDDQGDVAALFGTIQDITERKRDEDALRESEECFRAIFNQAAVGICHVIPDGRWLRTNQKFCDVVRYSEEELKVLTIRDLTHPDDLEISRKHFQLLLDRKLENYALEHRLIRRDRSTVWVNLTASMVSHANGNPKFVVAVVEDITKRKQAEAEIQDAREYAENTVETVREPLVVLNSDLKILTANHSFYHTFKVTPEETIGHFIYDLGNRQWDIPKLRVLFEDILPHNTVINGYEVKHDFLSIGRKVILLNARQIFREEIGSHIILLAMEDITERKQLETDIQDALEYAENIVETVREPLVVLNSELKILTANHSFYHTFMVTPEETIGNFIYDLGNRQWDIPKLRVLFEEILPQDTVLNGYEVEHDFLDIGGKIMLLNARQIFRENIGSNIILLAMEDITERKQLEAEIQDARKYAENIVETVRESLVVLNSELKILTANHSFYHTFKVTPEETIGNFIYDLGNRQWDIPKLRVLFEEILPQDTVLNGYEVEHDFIDIGRKIMLLNARQIFRENIGSNIILLAMEDITERKQLEAEIEDALKYAENIVETMIEPLVVLNSDLKVITANHSFYDTFKVTPEETIGNFIYDLGNRQWDIPKLRVLFEEILPQNTVFNGYEVEHDFLDIGRKIIMLNARQIFRENIGSHIILLAMEDITERKQLTVEVQDAREYAENIVETVREPLVVLNSELKILTANQSFYRTFKVTPEETIGNFIYDLGNRQWDIPKLRVLFEEILPNDTVFNDYEVEHDFLDIGHKVVLLNARQIFRENIGSNIILLAMEDFTERKYAEEEIKRLNMSLTDRAEELQAANNDLETFNYTVAHDLRQPLNLMSMYCQSIKLLCGDQLKEECLGYVQDAYQATLRMDGLIGALLRFASIGRVEPQREMVNLGMLAQEVARSLQRAEPERQVEFRIPAGIVANGDASLLRVVLDNLLGNAWKYSNTKEKAVIEFGVKDIDGVPTYFVRDNGAGFDMTEAGKLFAPFQRLPGSEKNKGFGIGLATVERIIQRHGGKVCAEGEPDRGATFYFTIAAYET